MFGGGARAPSDCCVFLNLVAKEIILFSTTHRRFAYKCC